MFYHFPLAICGVECLNFSFQFSSEIRFVLITQHTQTVHAVVICSDNERHCCTSCVFCEGILRICNRPCNTQAIAATRPMETSIGSGGGGVGWWRGVFRSQLSTERTNEEEEEARIVNESNGNCNVIITRLQSLNALHTL